MRRLVPANDVDLFTSKLIHDVADSAAPYADACADGIHLGINRGNGDLGAVSRLTGQRPDLDRVIADFRHFEFKQLANVVRVRLGQHDAHLVLLFPDVQNHSTNPLARLVGVARNHFTSRHERLCSVEVDRQSSTVETGHAAGHYGAHPLGVLFENGIPFVLADLLNHHLLGCLSGDAPQGAHLHRRPVHYGMDITGHAINLNHDILGILIRLAHGGNHGHLKIDKDTFFLDVLVTTDGVDKSNKIGVHLESSRLSNEFISRRPVLVRPYTIE